MLNLRDDLTEIATHTRDYTHSKADFYVQELSRIGTYTENQPTVRLNPTRYILDMVDTKNE